MGDINRDSLQSAKNNKFYFWHFRFYIEILSFAGGKISYCRMSLHKIEITYEEIALAELPADELAVARRAMLMAKKGYAPYSHFYVGAALSLSNGEVIAANNQENAAYPSGLCAERTALFYAKAQFPGIPIKCMSIAACQEDSFLEKPITPCGACRQVMLEYALQQESPMTLLMAGAEQCWRVADVRELLPLYFSL